MPPSSNVLFTRRADLVDTAVLFAAVAQNLVNLLGVDVEVWRRAAAPERGIFSFFAIA